MKPGHKLFAIICWLFIPAAFFYGLFFDIYQIGKTFCVIGAPIFLFIAGLIALLTGREKESDIIEEDIES